MCSLVKCLIIITDPVAEIVGGVLGGALGALVLVAVVVVVRYMKHFSVNYTFSHSQLGCLLWRKRRVQKV